MYIKHPVFGVSRVRGPLSRYYRAALRHVGCMSGGAALPPAARRDEALRLALAGVLAPSVYDLGELVSKTGGQQGVNFLVMEKNLNWIGKIRGEMSSSAECWRRVCMI